MIIVETSNYVTERIEHLRKVRGISRYRLAQRSGLSQSYISTLFNRPTTPSIQTLQKICDGLDITLAQFFSYEDEYPNISTEQKKLLTLWNSLSDHKREIAIAYLTGLSQSS